MQQAFKQDRETLYDKYEFKNHEIQLINSDISLVKVTLDGF